MDEEQRNDERLETLKKSIEEKQNELNRLQESTFNESITDGYLKTEQVFQIQAEIEAMQAEIESLESKIQNDPTFEQKIENINDAMRMSVRNEERINAQKRELGTIILPSAKQTLEAEIERMEEEKQQFDTATIEAIKSLAEEVAKERMNFIKKYDREFAELSDREKRVNQLLRDYEEKDIYTEKIRQTAREKAGASLEKINTSRKELSDEIEKEKRRFDRINARIDEFSEKLGITDEIGKIRELSERDTNQINDNLPFEGKRTVVEEIKPSVVKTETTTDLSDLLEKTERTLELLNEQQEEFNKQEKAGTISDDFDAVTKMIDQAIEKLEEDLDDIREKIKEADLYNDTQVVRNLTNIESNIASIKKQNTGFDLDIKRAKEKIKNKEEVPVAGEKIAPGSGAGEEKETTTGAEAGKGQAPEPAPEPTPKAQTEPEPTPKAPTEPAPEAEPEAGAGAEPTATPEAPEAPAGAPTATPEQAPEPAPAPEQAPEAPEQAPEAPEPTAPEAGPGPTPEAEAGEGKKQAPAPAQEAEAEPEPAPESAPGAERESDGDGKSINITVNHKGITFEINGKKYMVDKRTLNECAESLDEGTEAVNFIGETIGLDTWSKFIDKIEEPDVFIFIGIYSLYDAKDRKKYEKVAAANAIFDAYVNAFIDNKNTELSLTYDLKSLSKSEGIISRLKKNFFSLTDKQMIAEAAKSAQEAGIAEVIGEFKPSLFDRFCDRLANLGSRKAIAASTEINTAIPNKAKEFRNGQQTTQEKQQAQTTQEGPIIPEQTEEKEPEV